MGELNIRKVTLSADKASYGVTLRAEPDHKTLGPRLGGAFKSVMADIKKLDDSTLTSFVDGGKLEVQGHSLAREEVRIMYTFAGDSSKDLAEKYEADSSGEILVLLDTTPSLLLENPIGRSVEELSDAVAFLAKTKTSRNLFQDKEKKKVAKIHELSRYAGQTLYL